MIMKAKKISALLLAAAMMVPAAAPQNVMAAEEAAAPKYIFLFMTLFCRKSALCE